MPETPRPSSRFALVERGGARIPACLEDSTRSELSLLFTFTILCQACCVLVIVSFSDFWHLVWHSADNFGYISIAHAIKTWDFSLIKPQLFWGTGYATALVSSVTGLNEGNSFWIMSYACGLAAIYIVYRLYGFWPATCFATLNSGMVQRFVLGGAEPLFTLLLLSSFLAARRRWFLLASALAALATVVRPVGVFAAAGIWVLLTRERRYRVLWASLAVVLTVAACYSAPLTAKFASPFANVAGYSPSWYSNFPLTLPLYVFIKQMTHGGASLFNTAKIFFWVILTLIAVVLGWTSGRLRIVWNKYPAETIAVLLYLLFFFSYNTYWAWVEYLRYTGPVWGLLFFLLYRKWLDRFPLLLMASICGGVLAGLSAVNTYRAFGILHGLLRGSLLK